MVDKRTLSRAGESRHTDPIRAARFGKQFVEHADGIIAATLNNRHQPCRGKGVSFGKLIEVCFVHVVLPLRGRRVLARMPEGPVLPSDYLIRWGFPKRHGQTVPKRGCIEHHSPFLRVLSTSFLLRHSHNTLWYCMLSMHGLIQRSPSPSANGPGENGQLTVIPVLNRTPRGALDGNLGGTIIG